MIANIGHSMVSLTFRRSGAKAVGWHPRPLIQLEEAVDAFFYVGAEAVDETQDV